MSITIVETAGSASANSFVSVAEADAYLATRLNASSWPGSETEAKKASLCEATRDISDLAFKGLRTTDTQALSWPRANAPDPDASICGTIIDSSIIPQRVKDCTIELALEYLRAGTTDVAALDSTTGIIQDTVGLLSTIYAQPSQRPRGLDQYPRIARRIAPLLETSAGQVRLTR